MALALILALAFSGAQADAAAPASDQPIVAGAPESLKRTPPVQEKAMTREAMEDAIPDGAPKDDYEFVAWCHGALAGQIELDPLVEKDMDAIEGKEKAAKRKADDVEIAKEHRRYLALYEKALSAAEKASPAAIHEKGVDAELTGYKIWGPTRNKAPIWRMVDWGNWEVPPRCEKAAKRLYDRASLFGEALTAVPASTAAETTPPPTSGAPAKDAPSETAAKTDAALAGKTDAAVKGGGDAPAAPPPAAIPAKDAGDAAPTAPADAPDPGKSASPAHSDPKSGGDELRGPQ